MSINDPVAGYSATVRDDDLLLKNMMIGIIRIPTSSRSEPCDVTEVQLGECLL